MPCTHATQYAEEVPVVLDVSRFDNVVVSNRSLERGHVLTESDLHVDRQIVNELTEYDGLGPNAAFVDPLPTYTVSHQSNFWTAEMGEETRHWGAHPVSRPSVAWSVGTLLARPAAFVRFGPFERCPSGA